MSEQKNQHDRSDEGKGVLIKPEDEPIMEEQNKLGKIMDASTKRELFLKKHKDVFVNDDSLMLYRLPLNEQQIEKMYYNLIDEKV